MTTHQILHVLRSPYGHNYAEIRKVALAAADRIEELERKCSKKQKHTVGKGLRKAVSCQKK